jgi:hypothetical protein
VPVFHAVGIAMRENDVVADHSELLVFAIRLKELI